MYKAGKNPTRAGADEGTALAQRDVAVPASGLEAEDVGDGPLHHLAPAPDPVTTTAPGRRQARSSTGGRAARSNSQYERIVGAGDGPHVVLMDFTLTPEQELIRASARELCDRELVPHARDWDEAEELPRALVGKLAEAGFLAARPARGARRRRARLGLVLPARARSSARPTRRSAGSSRSRTGSSARRSRSGGRTQQKQRAPAARSRAATRSAATRSPSPAAAPTRPRSRRGPERDGDGWVLHRLEGLHHARHAGPRPRSSSRARAVTARRGSARFLVPTGAEGFEAQADEGEARAARAGHGRALPRRRPRAGRGDARRGGRGVQGRDVGARQRPHLARRRVRRDRAGLPRRVRGLREGAARRSGKPIAAFQLVQQLLAEMHVETDAARLLTWRAASLADAGASYTTRGRRWRSGTRARRPCAPRTPPSRCSAATATSTNTLSAKYLRDARVTTLYEGTSQIQKLIVGRALTGESAFN